MVGLLSVHVLRVPHGSVVDSRGHVDNPTVTRVGRCLQHKWQQLQCQKEGAQVVHLGQEQRWSHSQVNFLHDLGMRLGWMVVWIEQ